MKKIMFLFLLLCLCTSCQSEMLDEGLSFETTVPETVNPTQAVSMSEDNHYEFYDESVKESVEEYFDKTADELTETDYKALSDFLFFKVEGPVKHLRDIPNLFPKLRYIYVNFNEPISKEDYDILLHMEDLRAISLSSPVLPSLDFTERLLYVEVMYQEEAYRSEQNNLASLSVLDEGFIKENVNGKIQKYVKLIEDNRVFELICSNDSNTDTGEGERKIFISDNKDGSYVHLTTLDVKSETGDYVSNQLSLVDVDFDGKKDILVDNGHFGNQGLIRYTCFFNRNDSYKLCEGFSQIANPSIDHKNKKILSVWRNWAASHSWAMYSHQDGEYIMTDCLTSEADTKEEDEEIWIYRVEKLKNGKMKKTGVYTTKDYTDEQIEEKFYREDGYWGLLSDKWKTLYNMGTLVDYSIYGSDAMNSTIYDIIRD